MPLGSKSVVENPVPGVKWGWRSAIATILFSIAVFIHAVYFLSRIDELAESSCEDAFLACTNSDRADQYKEIKEQVIMYVRLFAIGLAVLGIVLLLIGVSGMFATAKNSICAMTTSMMFACVGGVLSIIVFGVGIAAEIVVTRFCRSLFQWEDIDSLGYAECTSFVNAFLPLFCPAISAGDIYCWADGDQCSCFCDDTIDSLCHYLPQEIMTGGILCGIAAIGLCTFGYNMCCSGMCCCFSYKKQQIRDYNPGIPVQAITTSQ